MTAPKALAHPTVAPVWREFVDYHCSDAYLRELVRLGEEELPEVSETTVSSP